MMLVRTTLCLAVLSLAGTSCAPAASSDSLARLPTPGCAQTQGPSPDFALPAPYPAKPPGGDPAEFWYGSPALWTRLRLDGTWAALPRNDQGFSQKVFWWSQDYSVEKEPIPALTVKGRRLDALDERLIASSATNAYGDFGEAMLVGVSIPTEGCWEITGIYRGRELSFVVQVLQ